MILFLLKKKLITINIKSFHFDILKICIDMIYSREFLINRNTNFFVFSSSDLPSFSTNSLSNVIIKIIKRII